MKKREEKQGGRKRDLRRGGMLSLEETSDVVAGLDADEWDGGQRWLVVCLGETGVKGLVQRLDSFWKMSYAI
ncbi:Uncharacterized protein TCM_023778 [Theobroma cacao]|uniref:Uncharacterized protein n=1 Tax=Theobroma cacao TaxID=3641 RepID=A0A061EUH6_THECC|nr:Uncharacterized protein TCM_023778 [Theobroma cacao]